MTSIKKFRNQSKLIDMSAKSAVYKHSEFLESTEGAHKAKSKYRFSLISAKAKTTSNLVTHLKVKN